MKYGYIDKEGFLVERELTEIKEHGADKDGNFCMLTITVEEQIEDLTAKGWKHVDEIDTTGMTCQDHEVINATPYDAGDHIAYNYEVVFATGRIKQKVKELKKQLADSDYKIIKSYEVSLLGQSSSYDIEGLHQQRQAMREEINGLESLLL